MKKFTMLFLMLFGAIGFAQQTTLKANGVDNPTHYNTAPKAKTVVLTESQRPADAKMMNFGENKPIFIKEKTIVLTESQRSSDVNMKNLGENKPFFIQQEKVILSESQRAADADMKNLGENKPFFINGPQNRSAVPAAQSLQQNVRPLERSLFGSFGFSSSGVEGRVSTNPPAGTATFNGTANRTEASVVITHSTTQNILAGNSVTCNSGNIPDENSFFRDFNLAADFGITEEFNVTSAEFAVEDSGGPTNLTINIYSTSTVFPGGYPGSATLQGTASYVSGAADAGTVVSVPVTATIPAGAIMIYELKINAGATFLWFPGSNADGQTGVSWIMSDACGISTPTNLADIGFPEQHMVMNIVGEEGTGGGGSFPDPYCAVNFNSVEPITLVEVAGISNRSSEVVNGSPAHEDFTSVVGNMEEGESYTIALEGNTDGGYTASFTVFIDWNQDGILDNASERYEIGTINASTGVDGKQATNTITVPAGVTAGPTRMRVMKKFSAPYVVDSCTGTSYGQAEDYTINVTAGGGGGTGGPCATTAPSNSFENGKSFTKNLGRVVANDITVVDGEDMLLESITFTAFIGSTGSGVNADNVDVFIYQDNGSGAPGALLTSQTSLVPTSQVVIGGNFGYDAWSIELDITDVNLEGQTGSNTTYWVGLSLEPTDGSNTFWEYSTTGVVGLAQAYDDGTGFIVEAGIEGVYSFDGTCTPIGGGGTGGPCATTAPSNAFENGKSFTKNLGRVVANDITVVDGEDMLLESITFTAFIGSTGSGVNADNVDVFIYEDNGSGAPGALLTSQTSMVPTSQVVIGGNFGYDAWSIELDITDVNLEGQTGSATTYWVGLSLEPTDGSNTFWEYSTAGVVGLAQAYNDGTGFIVEAGIEGVYSFDGTCTPMGGGGGVVYCIPEGTNSTRFIDNFSTTGGSENISNMGSGFSAGGYGDFYDTHAVTQEQGETVQFSVDIEGGTAGFRVWVDWNQDGVFDVIEEVAYASTSYENSQTGSISVPADALEGDTRMRIVSHWLSTSGDVDPCATGFTYGEFEDYKFTVEEGTGGGGGVACSQDNPENAFENGFTTSKDGAQLIATDINVPADTDFSLEKITVNIWMGPGETLNSADITFYNNSGDLPGAVKSAYPAVVPVSQTVIGSNFGWDISEVVFEIAPEMLPGTEGSVSRYWVSLYLDVSSGSGFISSTTATMQGVPSAFSADAGGTWNVNAGWDTVYLFEGTCETTGGGGSDPCSETSPSNAFENGKSFTKNLGRITAADITIAADEDMMLETINLTAFIGSVGSGVNASNVDVFIYADSGTGTPGALLNSQLSLVPASQTVIGNNFGYDAWSIDLDIVDYNLPGQAGVTTTYWIGLSLEPTDGSNTFWEYTSAAVVGYGLAYDDGTGFIVEPTNETVYTFAGTCSPAGGGGGITNDECSGAIAVSCGSSVSGTTVGATTDSGAPTCGPAITSPGVWYVLDDNSGIPGNITVSLCDGSTTFDTKLSIYTGTCSALVCVDGNDDACGLQSEVTFASNGNTKYYILVHSFGGATGTFTLDVTCDTVGISENAFEGFSYYPNPTSDILNLNSVEKIDNVSFYNVLGQLVIDNQVNANTSKVDISGLSTGTYLMKVMVNGQIGTYRVIKN